MDQTVWAPVSFFSNSFSCASYRAEATSDLPPFLFRVSSPRSFGQLYNGWILSRDAAILETWNSSRLALGSRPPAEAADALNRHLWKIPTEPGHSNLVSWTTSLLFALRLAFYQSRAGIPLEDIKLCMVNTKLFPEGVFVRDLYLIKEYQHGLPATAQSFPLSGQLQTLTSLLDLRKQHYFGEFLSQGALHVDGKSCIVSLADLRDRGLLRLSPALDRDHGHFRWTNWVKQERGRWPVQTWALSWLDELARLNCLVPAELLGLVSLFKPGFYLAAAAAFASLQPRDPRNYQLLLFLNHALAADADDATLEHYFNPCNPFLTPDQHAADEAMPEVHQANTLIRSLAILREEIKKASPLWTAPATGSI